MYSCETVWVKVLVSKGWLQSEITVQTLQWKGYLIFRGKVKNLKNFLEYLIKC